MNKQKNLIVFVTYIEGYESQIDKKALAIFGVTKFHKFLLGTTSFIRDHKPSAVILGPKSANQQWLCCVSKSESGLNRRLANAWTSGACLGLDKSFIDNKCNFRHRLTILTLASLPDFPSIRKCATEGGDF